jgi:hypothetical protein
MMLLSDREISIRQNPSPFGQGFTKTTAPQAWWFCCAAISRHSKRTVTLCASVPRAKRVVNLLQSNDVVAPLCP